MLKKDICHGYLQFTGIIDTVFISFHLDWEHAQRTMESITAQTSDSGRWGNWEVRILR